MNLQATSLNPRLERVAGVFDLERHAKVRCLFVGTGGGNGFIQSCARIGLADMVLIDPDIVTESNVATQAVDPNSIGDLKVDALAWQLKAINPDIRITALAKRIEDIDDAEFAALAGIGANASQQTDATLNPILFGLTDNFYAQARTHRLGLHFGLTTICAQEYFEGMGAEITFTVPGVTPACHRCLTTSRYRAYLEQGYSNQVTSVGAPIFAAEMLNVGLGYIALAAIYHGTNHPRFGSWMEKFRDRNLIRMRMDPLFDEVLGDTFSRRIAGACEAESFQMLDSVFVHQKPATGQSPSRPQCPDCRGYGDLSRLQGTFADTREFPQPIPSEALQA